MPFTPKFVDLVRNFTTVQGTGPVALGAAVSGYTSLAACLSSGDQFYYCIQSVDKPQEREVGRGTMQADGRIAREPVQGELTHFSNGTKTIALVTAAEWFTRLEQAGGAASIEAASRSALANAPSTRGPAMLTERGREGLFAWDPSDLSAKVTADTSQGLYIAPASSPNGATGAWVRQFDGPVNPLWFGIVEGDNGGANGAGNSAALTAMLATLRTRAANIYTSYQGLEAVRVPVGYWEFAETIDLTDGAHIFEGVDTGYTDAHSVVLKFPAGVTGIRVQRSNTSGADTTDAVTHRGADGSIIRNLALRGAYTSPTEAEAHGIHLRARAEISNIYIENFEGDGIHINATSGGGANEGNANNSRVFGARLQQNRRGLYVNGADANSCSFISVDASSNRQWGFEDSAFLSNSYVGCHANGNGLVPGATPTVVTYLGNRYTVISGQEAGASTNAPSGTTANNTWWAFMDVGGASGANNIAEWASGATYRAGGSFQMDPSNANARHTYIGCYAEGGQGFPQLRSPASILGGHLATGTIHAPSAAAMPTIVSGLVVSTPGTATFGRLYAAYESATPLLTVHRTDALGPSKDAKIEFANGHESDGDTPNSLAVLSGRSTGADPATNWGQMLLWLRQAGAAPAVKFRWDASVFYPENNNAVLLGQSTNRWSTIYGMTGDFTTQLKVGGVKVLGAQGAAVADAAALTSVNATNAVAAPTQAEFNAFVAEFNKLRTDLGATRTQLNAALARLRAHGLIAA